MIIKPQRGDRITTMGETHRYDRTNDAVRAVHVHCLVTAPRLLDVGGIICSVGDDDAMGVIGPWVSSIPWVTHTFHPQL